MERRKRIKRRRDYADQPSKTEARRPRDENGFRTATSIQAGTVRSKDIHEHADQRLEWFQ